MLVILVGLTSSFLVVVEDDDSEVVVVDDDQLDVSELPKIIKTKKLKGDVVLQQ